MMKIDFFLFGRFSIHKVQVTENQQKLHPERPGICPGVALAYLMMNQLDIFISNFFYLKCVL